MSEMTIAQGSSCHDNVCKLLFTWDLNMHQEKKRLSMVIFFIFVHKNVYRIRFQKIKIGPLKGFEKKASFRALEVPEPRVRKRPLLTTGK